MNLAVVHSRAVAGIEAPPVTIEVHLSKGLPGLSIVGLPETAVKESRHRVRSAVINSGFEFPVRRITVNLAPADLPKEGGRFDLPIALGILAASGQISPQALLEYEIIGELALSGEVRPCRGVLPVAIATHAAGKRLIMPAVNRQEARLVSALPAYGAASLIAVCAHLSGQEPLAPVTDEMPSAASDYAVDLAEVRGQEHGKRALEIAAAGGHSLLMVGAPGSGKTMLASRLPTILPAMSEAEALEAAAVYSTSRTGFDFKQWRRRPFRAPHHSASGMALVGGSNPPCPGEISLAHRGVLFLDELPEFSRAGLEALREPLESGWVAISRASHQALFPAVFQLVAAMNPCPCGYYGDSKGRCRCTAPQVQNYLNKISGPLLDRIDLHLTVCPLPAELLMNPSLAIKENSAIVRERVCRVREIQNNRQQKVNAALNGEEMSEYCRLPEEGQKFLTKVIDTFGLSARSCHRILRVARTIADMAASEQISAAHLREAVSYRRSQMS
jgi:magnesium chelatase family protein